jgi:transcription elongation factor GreA
MAIRFPMTPAGKERLLQDIDRIKRELPLISIAIGEAAAHGDLKENAEYHAAREKQGLLMARLREYESKLAGCEIIDPTKMSGSKVRFGATVVVLDVDTDEKHTFRIVGDDEADFSAGLISYQAPIARGLLGKDEGDEVEVQTGAAKRNFEIQAVRYEEIILSFRPVPNI